MIPYDFQLIMPEWKLKREGIVKRDNYCCTKCGETKYLHVHHTYYINGNLAWEYPDEALITLCNKCHKEVHRTTKIQVKRPKRKVLTRLEKLHKKKYALFAQRLSLYENAKRIGRTDLIEFYKAPYGQEKEIREKIKFLESQDLNN